MAKGSGGGGGGGRGASPAAIEERADGIDRWATGRIRRGSRASTTMNMTAANEAAINLLNKSQNNYVLRVTNMGGGTRYRRGEDVIVSVIKKNIIDAARRNR